MTTRMVHPEHGATHAYDKGDLERLEKLGWSVETMAHQEQVQQAQVPVKRPPGRPPKAK